MPRASAGSSAPDFDDVLRVWPPVRQPALPSVRLRKHAEIQSIGTFMCIRPCTLCFNITRILREATRSFNQDCVRGFFDDNIFAPLRALFAGKKT
eukprot:2138611-Rhodomonas_salina.1